MGTTALLAVAVAVALGFDFTNGFHDTANAMATSISTRAMTPRQAVLLSAVLNLAGAIVATQVLKTTVANTIGSLVHHPGGVGLGMIVAALVGAIVWNLVTWRAGLPSSSSHALIGGLVGMGIAGYGGDAVVWSKVMPVVLALVTSPLLGLVLAWAVMVALLNALRRAHPTPVNRSFRAAQVLSGAFVSFSHGANDAQKTMGVITVALVSTGHVAPGPKGSFPGVPLWVVVAAAVAMGLGTYAGGWRIIRTMGTRIFRLEPVDGFVAQGVAAAVIQAATQLALPVSTTHVVSGSLMGVGASRHLAAVRWVVARRIVLAWLLTIPAAGLVAGALALVVRTCS